MISNDFMLQALLYVWSYMVSLCLQHPEVNGRRPGRSELPLKAKPKEHLNLSLNLINPPSRAVRYVYPSLFIFTNAYNFFDICRMQWNDASYHSHSSEQKSSNKRKKIKSRRVLQQYSICTLVHNCVMIEMLDFRGRDARLFPSAWFVRIAWLL